MNRVVLIGRLTKDPDLSFVPGSGMAINKMTIAVDRKVKKDGKQEADFINLIAFGKTAEVMAQYLIKGRLIGISGRIQTGSYEAKDGTKRYTTDVVVDEFQFLEKGNKPAQAPVANDGFDFDKEFEAADSEIPF